jgi:hypothetical protein
MELFGYNSVRELNTKNMGNSPSFLSITHTILKTDFAADFCFWTEQRLYGT